MILSLSDFKSSHLKGGGIDRDIFAVENLLPRKTTCRGSFDGSHANAVGNQGAEDKLDLMWPLLPLRAERSHHVMA